MIEKLANWLVIVYKWGKTALYNQMNSLASCTDTKKMKTIGELYGVTHQILLGSIFNGTLITLKEERIKHEEWGLAFYSIK